MLWQEEQPNRRIASRPREGSPPVHRDARCSTARSHWPQAIAAMTTRAREQIASPARPFALRAIVRAQVEPLGPSVGNTPLCFPDPCGEERETDHDEHDSEGDPHEEPRELLIRER